MCRPFGAQSLLHLYPGLAPWAIIWRPVGAKKVRPARLRNIAMIPALVLALTSPATPAPPAVGATVPTFTLPDQHRRPRALASFQDRKAVVVVFLGTECPL